ncbi:hypothetical protein [Octadecabacter sp. SW4]|uniref:hypothetical protein n=1 Tax=Octadecabacter sp. SW4 TaxID=2602067 RepID=UPI0011CD82D6|nr:hypothetical protein [Octadecabacter sp. SW4]
MKSFARRRELAHERRKTNLADALAAESWLICMAKNFAALGQKWSFSTKSAYFVEKLGVDREVSR